MKPHACAALMLLAGCAAGGTSRNAARLSGFIGLPEAAVLDRMGPPARQFTADGRTYLIYESKDISHIPGMDGIPPRIAVFRCETRFEIADGRVLDFDQHGSGCE